MNIAKTFFVARGKELLTTGSEQVTYQFIKQKYDLVKQRLEQHINTAASKYKNVCNLVLDVYPSRRNSIITELWSNKSDWICDWIKENASKMDNDGKKEIQNDLFEISSIHEYPIDVYHALRWLKIGNCKEAIDDRNKHFDELIKSEELSTIEGLEFVLERIDIALYQTSNEQNVLLNEGWREIDQRTAGNELKQLVKKVIRI